MSEGVGTVETVKFNLYERRVIHVCSDTSAATATSFGAAHRPGWRIWWEFSTAAAKAAAQYDRADRADRRRCGFHFCLHSRCAHHGLDLVAHRVRALDRVVFPDR